MPPVKRTWKPLPDCHLQMSRSTLRSEKARKFTIVDPLRKSKSRPGSASRASKSERKLLTGILDNEARRLCKQRDNGLCRRCGKLGIECHHIMSRRHNALRFNLLNLLSLCAVCHRLAHEKPDEFRRWLDMEIGVEDFAILERARNWPELTLQQMDDLITLYRGRV
jgi:hypothetical protein